MVPIRHLLCGAACVLFLEGLLASEEVAKVPPPAEPTERLV